ncbi:MAG: multidrug effflux MFS transporter [Ktedonobacteraceae bacterium]|nr:multidrug effflux MFS transporter [Ktedonobacteraceae bacterium]
MSTASESGQGLVESKGTPTRIRAFHVLILGGLTAFGPLSTDLYLPSLPTVSHDLGATMSQTQITMSATILGLSLGQILIGPISDARGRRWPLLISIVVFVLTSLLCAVAPSVTALTITRFVQGIAGAAGIVLALAIARDLYAGLTLARCISLLMTVNFLAPLIAPVLGGQLLTFTSWHGVFVTLALIGVVALLAVVFGLGETLPADRRQSGRISETLRTFRDLLANRRLVGYALTSSFTAAAGIVYLSSSPFIFQNIYGLSPMTVGFVFGGNALGLAIMAQIGARLVGRVAPQRLLALGVVALVTAGVALFVVVIMGIGLVGVLPPLFVITVSLGLIFPNAASLALATVNPEIAGSASALLGVLQLSVGAILAPLVGIAGTASAAPMAAAIAVFTIAALLAFVVLGRPAQKARAEEHAELDVQP